MMLDFVWPVMPSSCDSGVETRGTTGWFRSQQFGEMLQIGIKQFGGLLHFVAENFGETVQIGIKQFGEMQINAYFCLKISIRQWQYNSRESYINACSSGSRRSKELRHC